MVSRSEFMHCFADECIRAYFAALKLEAHNPEVFFELLDLNGDGAISSDTFVKGCLSLSGTAGKLEMARLSQKTNHVNSGLSMLWTDLEIQDSNKLMHAP